CALPISRSGESVMPRVYPSGGICQVGKASQASALSHKGACVLTTADPPPNLAVTTSPLGVRLAQLTASEKSPCDCYTHPPCKGEEGPQSQAASQEGVLK